MTLSLSEVLEQIGQRAAAASRILSQTTTAEKNKALLAIARRIEQETETILTANEADLRAGSGRGLSAAMLDRARLDPKRIRTIANSVREVVDLTDPTGEVLKEWGSPERSEDFEKTSADRGYWDYLRISAKRYQRRSLPLSQDGQCGDIARRVRDDPVKLGSGGSNQRRVQGSWPAGILGPVGPEH